MQLRRAFFGMVIGSIGAAGLISACATSAELGDDEDDGANTGASDASVVVDSGKKDGSASPPKGSSSSSGGKSSSSSSSGGSGGNASSGGSSSGAPAPPTPAEGEACDEPGKEYTRSCGLCGKQTATCFPAADPADQKVTAYSACTGEQPAETGCIPGTTKEASCGYCGTQTLTCSNSCKFPTSGTCTNQQTNTQKCHAGDTKIESLGCPAGKYLTWTCRDGSGPDDPNRCTWLAPPITQCAVPPNYVDVPAAGGVSHLLIPAELQTKIQRPTYCNSSTLATEAYGKYFEIRNTGTTSATVAVATSPDGSGADDRVLDIYGSTQPTTAAQVKACTDYSDSCYDEDDLFTSDSVDACVYDVTIAANSSAWVLVTTYSGAEAAKDVTIVVRR